MADRDVKTGRFTEGNQARLVHGGEAAVEAVQRGEPLRGLAAQEERQVVEDLETLGRAAMVREVAVRLHTACRLYWGAIEGAVSTGDLEKLDGYIRRFGWLAGASLRAWAQVRQERPDDAAVLDYEAILAAQRAREASDDDTGD